MLDKPGFLLRAEGWIVLAVSFAAYHQLNGNWIFFFVLFLWPDVFMLGYLVDPRVGASVYNLVHTEAGPLLRASAAWIEHWRNPMLLAIIWLAHIGMDRALGYGLKYPTFFKDTHLQRVTTRP